jgi:acetyl esterase/lipase
MKPTRVLLLTLCITVAHAQQRGAFTYDRLLERHDWNNDGVIAKDEFQGNEHMFDRMDVDQNGKIVREEFAAAMKQRTRWQRTDGRNEQDRFSRQGLQPGQQIPDLTVYDLAGNKVPLSNLWKERPALLVTASATCPISVRSCPSLKSLAAVNANYVNVGILYIKEAHPAEEAVEPGRGLGPRTHPQPATMEEKLKLANLFNEEVGHGTTVYVDSIDNKAASALGAGPNIGLLISTDGHVIERQGWFEPEAMTLAIVEYDGAVPSEPAPAPSPEKQFRKRQMPEGVTVHRNLEYAVEDGESLKLDLYMPANSDARPPLMVWIHGGGWKSGDKENVNGAILRLSGDGYAVASINYRLKDLSIHPKNIHDCKGAVRWLRANAETYGFDPKRVAVGGGSAGGHLSLLLGLSSGFHELEGTVGGNLDQSSAVRAIVDLYGPSEFAAMAKNSERFNKAHDFQIEQLKHASPLTYLTKDDPPVLILHGDADKTVPVGQSILVDERYRAMGLESELHILEGAGHGGMVFSDDGRYRVIKAFLDRHLME